MTTPHGADGGAAGITRALARGAGVNVVGVILKIVYPLTLVLATRLYGPAAVGVYILGTTILDVVVKVVLAGYMDGLVLHVARHLHRPEEEDRLYGALANAFAITLGLALVAIGLGWAAGPALVARFFPQPGVLPTLRVLLLSLPFQAVPVLVVAATNARMIMKYDAALMGFARPFALLLFMLGFTFADLGAGSLPLAFLCAQVVVALLSVPVFLRHYSLRRLLAAFRPFRFHRELTAFAVPQSANLTFTQLVTGMSVLMLGAFGLPPAQIAFYGTGAEIVRNIRYVRLTISSAFAPVISRLHAEGRTADLAEIFTTATRWTLAMTMPALLLVAAFHRELLLVFHASYREDSGFMLLVAVAAFLNCALGLHGNVVAMTGHSRWTLLNSLVVAALNVAANALLIPRFGLYGAAAAAALAQVALSTLEVGEARRLAGVRLRLPPLVAPFAAGAGMILVFAAFSRAAGDSPWPARLAVAAALLAGYAWLVRRWRPVR